MRILGLVLAGALALFVAISAHADPLGSKMTPAGLVPGVAQLNGGSTSGRHPMPGERGQSGNQCPSIRPNRKEGVAEMGRQTMLMARGVPYTVMGR